MPDGHAPGPPEQARLLLVDSARSLGDRLMPPLGAGLVLPPMVIELDTGRLALELLKSSEFDVIAVDIAAIADLAEDHEERIGRLARAASGALVIVLADDASISVALGAMRAGAHDCVCRDIEPAQIIDRMTELARRYGKARALLPADEPPKAADNGPSIPVMRDLILPMWRQEQKIIEDAIQSFAGNIALAAAALELSPSTIYRKRQAWAEMEGRRVEMVAAISAR
jgi:DNA-binding NtrC family response regulator